MLTDFEECQQFFMTVVSNAKTRHQALDTRQVAKVHTSSKDRLKSKHKAKGGDSVPSGIAIHGGYNRLSGRKFCDSVKKTEDCRRRLAQC